MSFEAQPTPLKVAPLADGASVDIFFRTQSPTAASRCGGSVSSGLGRGGEGGGHCVVGSYRREVNVMQKSHDSCILLSL